MRRENAPAGGKNCRMPTDDGAARDSGCLNGCGDPPAWCAVGNATSTSPTCTCGVGPCHGPPRPWRPELLGHVLRLHATRARAYRGVNSFTGYNELVLSPALERAPRSVEAVFATQCEGYASANASNSRQSLSATCAQARAFARLAHYHILRAFARTAPPEDLPPLLSFRPSRWDEPFAPA